MSQLVTYLNFDGNCREAMQFYASCLGAELSLMPFSDIPGPTPPGAEQAKDRIMHARLSKGSAVLMASDTMPGRTSTQGNNFSVSFQPDGLDELEKVFAAFSAKGKVTMPLADMFWGARFGSIKDQFGVNWMFNFELPKNLRPALTPASPPVAR